MLAKVKRSVMMPFIKLMDRQRLQKQMRTPDEIVHQSQLYHNMALEYEVKSNKVASQQYQAMSDALLWVLKVNNGNSK